MLQLSLDWTNMEEAVNTVRMLYDWIDIIELGTPMIFDYGLECVGEMKRLFPEKIILADMKIMDAGRQETEMAVKMGADIITVMGAANDLTIKMAAEAAHRGGKKLMADLLGVDPVEKRAVALEDMGVDYICVHTASDMRLEADLPVEELERVKEVLRRCKTAIAGGITLKELEAVMAGGPDVVIVGGGILSSPDPEKNAELFYQVCGGERRGIR